MNKAMPPKNRTRRTLRAPEMRRCIGCYACMQACARQNYASLLPQEAALRIHTKGGMQSGVVATICGACGQPDCAEACPTGAMLARPGGGAVFTPDLCNSCGACVQACPINYLRFSRQGLPMMCKHCGICVAFCPHQCLAMEVTQDE